MLYPRIAPSLLPSPTEILLVYLAIRIIRSKTFATMNRDLPPLGSCAIVCRVFSDLGQGLLKLIKLSLIGTPLSLALQIRICGCVFWCGSAGRICGCRWNMCGWEGFHLVIVIVMEGGRAEQGG